MRILELFKGTGSITNYFKDDPDVEIISLDILPKYNATITCDIIDWNYKIYDIGYFDIIWASPECKIFSMLQNTLIGRKWKDKKELQDKQKENSIYILKTIEIIEYFKPNFYFIENPLHSKIWTYVPEEYANKYVVVDYCAFGYNYKKPTKILTNKSLNNVRCKCKKHNFKIGITSKKETQKSKHNPDITSVNQRYSIPPDLIKYLLTIP